MTGAMAFYRTILATLSSICRIGLYASVWSVVSCTQAKLPVAPSVANAPTQLLIEVPSSIRVGLTKSVLARRMRNGTSRVVTADWSTDAPQTLLAKDGSISGMAAGSATLSARYEGAETSSPVTVVPDTAGLWTGQMKLIACTRESGGAPNPCDREVGVIQPYSLSLSNEGAPVTGSMRFFNNAVTGSIEGTVGIDGEINLSGQLTNAEIQEVIAGWRSRIQNGTWIPDQMISRSSFTNLFGPQVLRRTWTFVEVTRR